MSPILVRPVREQLEHDRVIRLLQAKYKRKFEVATNPGSAQTMPVGGPPPWYPDLVLQSQERGRRLLGVVEVETAESVNQMEAMSQWAAFSRLRAPFHLYVPVSSIDTARRLCTDLNISVAEIWTYTSLGDQVRFTLMQRAAGAVDGKGRAAAPRERALVSAPRGKAPAKAPVKAAAKPAKAAVKSAAKPVAKARAAAQAPARRLAAKKTAARAPKRK